MAEVSFGGKGYGVEVNIRYPQTGRRALLLYREGGDYIEASVNLGGDGHGQDEAAIDNRGDKAGLEEALLAAEVIKGPVHWVETPVGRFNIYRVPYFDLADQADRLEAKGVRVLRVNNINDLPALLDGLPPAGEE